MLTRELCFVSSPLSARLVVVAKLTNLSCSCCRRRRHLSQSRFQRVKHSYSKWAQKWPTMLNLDTMKCSVNQKQCTKVVPLLAKLAWQEVRMKWKRPLILFRFNSWTVFSWRTTATTATFSISRHFIPIYFCAFNKLNVANEQLPLFRRTKTLSKIPLGRHAHLGSTLGEVPMLEWTKPNWTADEVKALLFPLHLNS